MTVEESEGRSPQMITCPSCGFEAPDDFAFCPRCATALSGPPPIPEERKTVTALFCDLVGSTALGEDADPEDVDALMRRYGRVARQAVESYGGVVEKTIGDAVFAVFGVPTAHEDDAERAVRAALKLTRMVEGLPAVAGHPVRVRVGVNTGEALVRLDVAPGSGEGFLAGDAVNVGARLQSAAPPMGVVVGALTHELTRTAIVYEALAPVAAKGKREPLEAWLAKEPVARTGLRTSGARTTPFFGRAEELAVLHEALQDTVTANRSRVVLLVGEPGIGKSRLVLEFAHAVDESPGLVTWRQGRCLPYGEGVTFWALGQILKEHAGVLDTDKASTIEAKLEAALPAGEDRSWVRQRLRPLLGLEATHAGREESFAAWRRFLELLGRGGPAVIVLEDLHWADEAMLGFVDSLVSRDLKAPLLVVATTRPELLQRHLGPLTADGGSDRLLRLTLPVLSKEQARALVAALLESQPATEAGARLAAAIGGNPLYAEQYVRLLLDRGLLVREADGLHLAMDTDLPLPETVHAVLAARLDTLPPDQKALLCDAAVLGETFWLGGLAAVSGRDESVVDRGVSELLARDFVRSAITSTMRKDREYVFWHALTRDVAYKQLPRKVRARKHEAAARWIEERAGEGSDEPAEIVAYHYTAALDLAGAVGDAELTSRLVPRAIDALRKAGRRALRLDVAAAERHLERALALASDSASVRLELLPIYAEALMLRNRHREAASACEEAIAGFRSSGDVRSEAAAMCWLANVRFDLGEPAGDLMREAAEKLANDEPSPEKAEVLGHYAVSLIVMEADAQAVIAAADGAIATCERLGAPDSALALHCRGLARLWLGDLGGLDDYERAVAAAVSQGLGMERATIEFNQLSIILALRGARAAHEAALQGLQFARAHGLEAYVFAFRSEGVDCLWSVGGWDQALAEIRYMAPGVEEAEDAWDLLLLRAMEARLLAARGEAREAEPYLDWIVTKARESEVLWTRTAALLFAAIARLGLGETDTAVALLTEAVDPPKAAVSQYEQMTAAVRTAVGGGDVALADRIRDKLDAHLPEHRLPLHHHVLTTMDALLAKAHGEDQAAAAGFADAAARWRAFGMPYEEAQALLGQGRCLVALGRAPEAAPVLGQAREIFVRLGAKPALEETEKLLAQPGAAAS